MLKDHKVLTAADVKRRIRNFPVAPPAVERARDKAEKAEEKLDVKSGWELVYRGEPEPNPENPAWKKWLRETLKAEMWGLANNRQNFTEIKALESRAEEAGVRYEPINPKSTGRIETAFERARENPKIEFAENEESGPVEPYKVSYDKE